MNLVSAALTPDQTRPSEVWQVDDGTQWVTSGTTSYNFPIDGTALLATSSSLQNARNTHGVDLSEMDHDATRIFCQVTWNFPHAKQDAFLEHAHAERAAADSGA
jgi:hypothetical protein